MLLKISPTCLEMMWNYLLNIMEEFHSDSEFHITSVMLVHFAIYMTESLLEKKISQICVNSIGNLFGFLKFLMSQAWKTHVLKLSLNSVFVMV